MFSNETKNFGLPKYAPLDHPDFLTDINGAFETIDTTMYDNQLKGRDLREDLDDVSATVDTLENSYNELREQLNSVSDFGTDPRFKSLSDRVDGLSTEITTAKENITTNATNISANKTLIESLTVKLNELKQTVVDIQAELGEHDTTMTAINNSIEQMRNSVGRVQSALDTIDAQADKNTADILATRQEVAEYHGKVDTMQSRVNALNTEVSSNTARVTQVEKNIVKNNTSTGTLTVEVDSLKTSDTALNNRVTTIDDRVTALEQNSGSGETVSNDALNAVLNRVTALETAKTEQASAITANTAKGVENAGRIDELETSIANVEADIAENDTAITTLTQSVNALQEADTSATASIANATAVANDALTKATANTASIATEAGRIDTVIATANTDRTKLTEVETKANNNATEIQNVKDALEEVSGTGGELTGLSGRVTTAEGKISTLENNASVQDTQIQANADAILSTRGDGFTNIMTNYNIYNMITNSTSGLEALRQSVNTLFTMQKGSSTSGVINNSLTYNSFNYTGRDIITTLEGPNVVYYDFGSIHDAGISQTIYFVPYLTALDNCKLRVKVDVSEVTYFELFHFDIKILTTNGRYITELAKITNLNKTIATYDNTVTIPKNTVFKPVLYFSAVAQYTNNKISITFSNLNITATNVDVYN